MSLQMANLKSKDEIETHVNWVTVFSAADSVPKPF